MSAPAALARRRPKAIASWDRSLASTPIRMVLTVAPLSGTAPNLWRRGAPDIRPSPPTASVESRIPRPRRFRARPARFRRDAEPLEHPAGAASGILDGGADEVPELEGAAGAGEALAEGGVEPLRPGGRSGGWVEGAARRLDV